jgi:DNA-binding transcriptional LysR family regulator
MHRLAPIAQLMFLMIDIDWMNISAVNLNLLAAFQALVEEKNVTRAARRMGVTQPAMSSTLAQLRELFDDPLFRRTSHGLEPTPRALALRDPIHEGLRLLSSTLVEASFDPKTADKTFVIAASDYVEFVLLPPLLRHLQVVAPGVRLQVRAWGLHEVPEFLAHGEADLMIGYYDTLPPHHAGMRLFSEEYTCIVRRGHPRVKKKLSLPAYLELGHVLVSEKPGSPGSVDRALAKQGKSRNVAARVSHFLMVPMLVARTDLVAAISRRVAEPFAKPLGLALFSPPIPLPKSFVNQAWHSQMERDPAHRWLRETVAQVATELEASPRA